MLDPIQQHCLKGIGVRYLEPRQIVNDETAPDIKDVNPALATELLDTRKITSTEPARHSIAENTTSDTPSISATPDRDLTLLNNWDGLNQQIHGCNSCPLAQNCTQKVAGVGSQNADVMLIGEGPGHDEDIRGEPFVGKSGQLLDKMLSSIGMARESVFITNIVKCRPPNNRDPRPDEVSQCSVFLKAQIELIKPRIILSVGRISAHSLLNTSEPVGKLLQDLHQLPDSEIPVKVTYHPAYLLRTPSAKSIAWKDLKILHKCLSR